MIIIAIYIKKCDDTQVELVICSLAQPVIDSSVKVPKKVNVRRNCKRYLVTHPSTASKNILFLFSSVNDYAYVSEKT